MHNIQTYGVKIEENERLIKKSIKYIELGLLGPNFIEIGDETRCQDESNM